MTEEKMSVSDMGLSTSAENALRRAGISTIGELIEYDNTKNLTAIHALGALSLSRIRSVCFEKYGIRLTGVDQCGVWQGGKQYWAIITTGSVRCRDFIKVVSQNESLIMHGDIGSLVFANKEDAVEAANLIRTRGGSRGARSNAEGQDDAIRDA